MKAYSGNEPFIFVSYAHDDRDVVYPIIELLQDNGYHVWYDEGLHIGNDWRDELAERIANCRAFIYMCSERSVKSGYCRDEIYAADNEMKSRLDADAEKDLDDCLQMVTVKLDESNLSGGIGLVLNSRQVLSGIGVSAEEITKQLSGIEKLDVCRDQFRYVEGVNWGPAREGYYFDLRPDHAVFNSIVDNPIYGDERHFLAINGRSQSAEDHLVEVLPGNRYTVSIYYCNDAASLSNTTGGGKGISMKTKVTVKLPEMLCAGKQEILQAEISSTTAEPQRVWDQIALQSPVDAVIDFTVASAKLFNHGKLSGEVLGSQLFMAGTYIGHNKSNGVIPGGMEYSGRIEFQFDVKPVRQVPFKRMVSVDGRNYTDQLAVLPGDLLTFRDCIRNEHHDDILDVTFRDVLPDGMELIPGTVVLYAEPEVEGRQLSDHLVSNGINTGLFGENIAGVIQYKARVREDVPAPCKLVSEGFLVYTETRRDSENRYKSVVDKTVRKHAETVCFVRGRES